MNNLFLFANSYSANMLIRCIRDMVNFKIDNILLMKENHPDSLIENIVLCDTLEEAVTLSKIVIIVKDNYIPIDSISMIKKLARKHKVKCYIVKDQWDETKLPDIVTESRDFGSYDTLPCVLNVSFGPVTQQLIGEMYLRNIMLDNNIDYSQVYSKKTKSFLEDLMNNHILNEEIERHLGVQNNVAIQIISIDLGSDINKAKEYFELIRVINPDYLVFQSNVEAPDYKMMEDYLRMINTGQESFCIRSHYYETSSLIRVFIKNIDTERGKYHSVYSPNLVKNLSNSVFSKLAFPEGMFTL